MATYRFATKDLSINAAESFIRAIQTDKDTSTNKESIVLYACIGRTEPWSDEPNVDSADNNLQHLQYEAHRHFIGAKKIQPSNVSHVANRYDWQPGTVYRMFRDTDNDLCTCNYFVTTDENNVYKCLYNNNNALSIVKPTGFSTRPFTTSDGYTWKYMYTISLGEANKFMTPAFIPVKTLTSSNGSVEDARQLAVQNAAVNGAIDIIEVNNAGTNYKQLFDASVSVANATHIRISAAGVGANAASDPGYYTGMSVYVISGTGAGQLRRIVNYNGPTRTLTANAVFNPICNTDSKIVISPTVTIVGDGQGAKAYALVDTTTGAVSNVTVLSTGSGYTRAEAFITSNNVSASFGFGATANVIISPPGGHGSDPVRELHSDKVMLNVQFLGEEGVSGTGKGYIPSNTEFRTLTIIKDPMLKVDRNNDPILVEKIANTSNSPSSLRLTTRLEIAYDSLEDDGSPTNAFEVNDIITNERNMVRARQGRLEFVTELNRSTRENAEWQLEQAVKAANGNVVYVKQKETDAGGYIYNLYINNVESYGDYKAFTTDDNLVKSTDPQYVANVEDIQGPEANTFSGEIIYHEHLPAITRNPDQIEDFKIILDF